MEKKPSKYKIQKEEIPEFNLSSEVERLQKQLDKDPKSKVFLPLAEEYRRSRMPEEAIFILEEGIKYNPTYTAAKIALARAYLDLNEIMKAKKVIDEILIKMPNNPLALKLHGDISFREGDFLEARKSYQTAKYFNPQDAELDKKLSELQVGETGSKIEVASMGMHEEEMQIERSYIEHKTSPQQTISESQNIEASAASLSENVQNQQSVGSEQSQDIVMDENQIAGQPQIQYHQQNNQFSQQEEYQISQGQAVEAQNQINNFQTTDVQQQQSQYLDPSLQQMQYQDSVSTPEILADNQTNIDTYIQPNQEAYANVPLVSQEVVLPENRYENQEQYSIQSEAIPQDFQQQIPQQLEYSQFNEPSQINPNSVYTPPDTGGFYTGPPTEPLPGDIEKSEYSVEYTPPVMEEQQVIQINQGIPMDNSQAQQETTFGGGEFVTSQEIQDISQIEQRIAQSSIEELYNNLDLSTVESKQPHTIMPSNIVQSQEFDLKEIEGEINIPMESSYVSNNLPKNINQNQYVQKNIEMNNAVPPVERITIDSLDIEDVNLDKIAMEDQNKSQEVLSINDIASEIKTKQEANQKTGVVDIFKKPVDTINTVPEVGKIQGGDKYDMDLAELYTKQGHYDKSLEIYKKLIEFQPDNPDLINRLIETEKMKNAEVAKEQSPVSPTERIAKMEEWFRSLKKDKNENGS